MRIIVAVAMAISMSVALAAVIQAGKGTGPAKVSVGAASASGAAPLLPHFGTPCVYDSNPDMTYPNWGRKLARDTSGMLHLAYTGANVACYKQSTDDGATWSTPETIGAGRYPALALNVDPDDSTGLCPWVVYLTPQDSIMRAIRHADGTWDHSVIFQGNPGDSAAGAPSLAVDVTSNCAYATYPVYVGSPASNLVYLNAFTSNAVSPPETVDAAGGTFCYGASIAATPGNLIHVAWVRGQSIYYRERVDTVWTPAVRISSQWGPATEPASNPFMEAYGDTIFCVWRVPNDSPTGPGEIWRRVHWLSSPVWGTPLVLSQSPDKESDFPVMGSSGATFWHEEVTPTNYDPWVLHLGGQYLFQTPLMSRYPHVYCYFPTPDTFKCDAVWTEQVSDTPPLYEVRSGAVTWPPGP